MDQELEQTINSINSIDSSLIDSKEYLEQINQTLIEIDGKLYDLNDFLIIKDEQNTKKNIEENKQENNTKSETRSEQEEVITLSDIHNDIQENNTLLQDQINLQTVSVFSQAMLIGVILLSMFWDRYFKK